MYGSASRGTLVEKARPPAIARAFGKYGGPLLHASAPPIASANMPMVAVAIVISTGAGVPSHRVPMPRCADGRRGAIDRCARSSRCHCCNYAHQDAACALRKVPFACASLLRAAASSSTARSCRPPYLRALLAKDLEHDAGGLGHYLCIGNSLQRRGSRIIRRNRLVRGGCDLNRYRLSRVPDLDRLLDDTACDERGDTAGEYEEAGGMQRTADRTRCMDRGHWLHLGRIAIASYPTTSLFQHNGGRRQWTRNFRRPSRVKTAPAIDRSRRVAEFTRRREGRSSCLMGRIGRGAPAHGVCGKLSRQK